MPRAAPIYTPTPVSGARTYIQDAAAMWAPSCPHSQAGTPLTPGVGNAGLFRPPFFPSAPSRKGEIRESVSQKIHILFFSAVNVLLRTIAQRLRVIRARTSIQVLAAHFCAVTTRVSDCCGNLHRPTLWPVPKRAWPRPCAREPRVPLSSP